MQTLTRRQLGILRSVILTVTLVWAFGVEADTGYVTAEHLWRFNRQPAAKDQEAGNRIASTADTAWLLHPDGHVLRRSTRAIPGSEGTRREVRVERFALPAGITAEDVQKVALSVASEGRDEMWLIDHTRWRLWHYRTGTWFGPWPFGEPVGSAAARGGELVVNTPGHSGTAFALVGSDGKVKERFGARLQPFRFGLDESWNQWALGVFPDGGIIAAHRYSERVRLYDTRLELRRETVAEFPAMSGLRAAAGKAEDAIRVDPATCCYAAKLVLFASRVVPLGARTYGIQFSGRSGLEEFSDDGKWRGSLPFLDASESQPIEAISAHGEYLLVATAKGVDSLRRVSDERVITGHVVDAQKNAVRGAVVAIANASAAKLEAVTDDGGRFTAVVPVGPEVYEMTVSAKGFRLFSHRGALEPLMQRPIVLARSFQQCVRVADAATAEPVGTFELEILREIADHRGAWRTRGALRTVSAPDGAYCLESPWDYPWTVKISAYGYASEKLTVTTTDDLTLAVALSREAVLNLTVVERSSGIPMEGVALQLKPADDAGRVGSIVEDEATAVSDANGAAHFDRLRPGPHVLEGQSDRSLPATTRLTIESGYNVKQLEVSTGSKVRVRVLSQASDEIVQDAVVTAELMNGTSGRLLQCTTGADGTCSISALGPGRYQARARAPGLVEGHRPFEVAEDHGTVDAEIRLADSLRLTGTVTGRDHYPDLDLEVMGSKPGVPFILAPVDADGRFAFEEFPAGDVNLRVTERGRDSTLVYQRVAVPSGRATHDIVLALPQPLELRGEIKYEDAGCGMCTLLMERLGGEVDRPRIQAKIERNGNYLVRLPGRGIYVAHLTGPETASDRRTLEINESRRENFELAEAARLKVTVLDARGTPVAAARVLALADVHGLTIADLTTDALGIASFRVPSEATRIFARKDRLQGSVVHDGARGPKSIEIVVRETGQLHIDLRDARTAAPVYRAHVRARSVRTGKDYGTQFLSRTVSEPFTVSVDSGDLTDLVIVAPGYAFKTVYAVSAEGEAHRIALRGGLTVGVRVSSNLRPCHFQLTGGDGRTYGLSTEFGLGRIPFTVHEALFNPVEPGTYMATLTLCGGQTLVRAVTVAPGETTPLVVFEQ